MNLSFKNRIALQYMVATALIMAALSAFVFFTVQGTVYRNLDDDLSYEAEKHRSEIIIQGDSIQFINRVEWEEREHTELQVNPVFIQIIDTRGRIMDKSPNLKEDVLPFIEEKEYGGHFNRFLKDREIRQIQIPIQQQGKLIGYLQAAMSFESSKMVILKLRNVLLISYLLVLLGFYFVSRYLAGRSIKPINSITETTNKITRNNLNERVDLPINKDELYQLSSAINELLQRIENVIHRERQFTSDASHELRTPLSALRGTLEVLIRKPRTQAEYEEKIKYSLSEIDRMTSSIEQLLLLAGLDANPNQGNSDQVSLTTLVDEILSRYKDEIDKKNLKIDISDHSSSEFLVPQYYSNLIIDNIISNAIKYSNSNTCLYIIINNKRIVIKDEGIGIKADDMEYLFNHFYRSGALDHKHISGNGLGLSIAKKSADAIKAELLIESKLGTGTEVTIQF